MYDLSNSPFLLTSKGWGKTENDKYHSIVIDDGVSQLERR